MKNFQRFNTIESIAHLSYSLDYSFEFAHMSSLIWDALWDALFDCSIWPRIVYFTTKCIVNTLQWTLFTPNSVTEQMHDNK